MDDCTFRDLVVGTAACPRCGGALQPVPGRVGCARCGHRYTVHPWGIDFVAAVVPDVAGVPAAARREQYRVLHHGDWRDRDPAWAALPDDLDRALARTATFYDEVLRQALDAAPVGAVTCLDVGCAAGRLTRAVAGARPGWRVLGVDVNAEHLATAAALTGPCGAERPRTGGGGGAPRQAGWCGFARSDATRLAVRDAGVDLLLAVNVLDRLDDPVGALKEWTRVLRPGGTMTLSSCHDWPTGSPWAARWRDLAEMVADHDLVPVGPATELTWQVPDAFNPRLMHLYMVETRTFRRPDDGGRADARARSGMAGGRQVEFPRGEHRLDGTGQGPREPGHLVEAQIGPAAGEAVPERLDQACVPEQA